MPKSVWSGTVEFGLVSIPLSLSAATENKSISFHQLHTECGTRIKEQRYCPHCERVVEYSELEKGYEYAKGNYVKVTKEDLENLPLPSKKVIVLDNFVKQEEIDPIYFNGTYFAEPDKAGERPYSLLMETLKKKNLVAIGTLALRNKERLCCIRVFEDSLLVEVLLYPDEIRQHVHHQLNSKVSEKELDVADRLVDMMSGPFEPEKYTDHYRDALMELIQGKVEGEPDAEAATGNRLAGGGKVLDLMEALQASIDSAKTASKSGAAKATKSPNRSANKSSGRKTEENSSDSQSTVQKNAKAKSSSGRAKTSKAS